MPKHKYQLSGRHSLDRNRDDYDADRSNYSYKSTEYKRSQGGRHSSRGHGDVHFKARGNRGRHSGNLAIRRAIAQINPRNLASGDIDIEMDRDAELWWKVTVIFGTKYPRQWLHDQLQIVVRESASVRPFFNWRVEEKNVVYYMRLRKSQVKGFCSAAQTVKAADGHNLIVNTSPPRNNEPSMLTMSDGAVEALKLALVRRWNASTACLDLSRLHEDVELLANGHYLPLSSPCVVTAISQIINDNAPPVTQLLLSNNKLFTLSSFKGLIGTLTTTLRHLNLSNNDFRHESFSDVLRSVPLVSIDLKGNPLMHIRDNRSLVTILRNKWSTLQVFNGETLPPKLEFGDTGESTIGRSGGSTVPTPIPTMGTFPNDEAKLSILNFLKTFMETYDKNRQSLMQMYSEQATLTIHSWHSQIGVNHRPLRIYTENSRNLLRVREKDRRARLLYRGRLQVVSALDRLPPTMHLMETVRVDVASSTPAGILLFMTGVFIERDAEANSATGRVDKTVRCFSRSLVLVPPLEILLDDLYVTNATQDIIRHWIKGSDTPKEAPPVTVTPNAVAMAPTSLSVPAQSVSGGPSVPSEVIQAQLVSEFSKHSGMNVHFSRQCLEEFVWDFEKAAAQFLILKERGAVPPEAFIQ